MLILICGAKGSGKTTRIIEKANADVKSAKGDCVYVSDTERYMYDVDRNVKFVNVEEYGIKDPTALEAFVCGVMAGRSDLTNIYIDGVSRITGLPPKDLQGFYTRIAELADNFAVSATVTVSAAADDLPDYLMKYKII